MKLLDLFCGAGGAAVGYKRSQLVTSVTGVDIKHQPNYPYEFIQGDALEYLYKNWWKYDIIHASPPCQRFSTATPKLSKENHPDLLTPTKDFLKTLGIPYVIENVPGSPLENPLVLCGTFFNLKVYRHRLFEVSPLIPQPEHKPHQDRSPGANRGKSPKGFISVVGHRAGIQPAKGVFKSDVEAAMGIYWMSAKELSQAIPPAFTEYIGQQIKLRLTG